MAVGDLYSARAATTGLLANIPGGELQLTFDTPVDSSPDVAVQGGGTAHRLQNSGIYLVLTSVGMTGVDIGNNNRHVARTNVKVGGVDFPSVEGRASSFLRDSGSAEEGYACTITLVDHTVVGGTGDDVEVFMQNFGDTSVSLADQIPDSSSIQIITLDPATVYTKVSRSTLISATAGSIGYAADDAPTVWDTVAWETQDAEIDPAVIEWVSGSDITLKEAGHYLTMYYAESDTGSTTREAMAYRLLQEAAEVRGSRQLSYMRSTDGAVEAWLAWGGVVEAAAGDVLQMQFVEVNETAATPRLVAAAMTVAQLPPGVVVTKAVHSVNRPGETLGVYPLDDEDFDVENNHDPVTNNSRLNGSAAAHDWLLLFSWWARTSISDNTRVTEHFRWNRSGTILDYGSGLSYHRGDQSSNGIPAAGRTAMVAIKALAAGQWVAADLRHESGVADQNRDFIADRVALTGLALDTLAFPAASVDVVEVYDGVGWQPAVFEIFDGTIWQAAEPEVYT